MTKYVPWTPPPGAVVPPPVHPETVVHTVYSDGATYHDHCAGRINWSSEGDGPRVVAYAVVQEYKPEPEPDLWFDIATAPRDGTWFYAKALAFDDSIVRVVHFADSHDRFPIHDDMSPWHIAPTQWRPLPPVHVREVPQGREVVAWAVVQGDVFLNIQTFYSQSGADHWAAEHGGTVVKLTGVDAW